MLDGGEVGSHPEVGGLHSRMTAGNKDQIAAPSRPPLYSTQWWGRGPPTSHTRNIHTTQTTAVAAEVVPVAAKLKHSPPLPIAPPPCTTTYPCE